MGTPKLAVLRASLGNDHFQHVVLSWYGRFVFVRRAIITITISRWGVLPLFYSYGSIELSTGGCFWWWWLVGFCFDLLWF